MKKTPQIFTIGSATFDIFVKPGDQAVFTLEKPESREKWLALKYGGKVKIDDVVETFGGGATNTAVAFSRMGFKPYFVGKVGAEYGDKVLGNLSREGVNTDYATKTKRDRTGFSTVISTLDGDRTVLGYAGANRLFTAKDLPLSALAKADLIFINHISGDSECVLKALVTFLDQYPRIQVAWNPGYEQLVAGVSKWKKLLRRIDFLFVNKEEAALFTKVPYRLAGVKHHDPQYHVHAPTSFLPPYADDVTDIMLKFFEYGVKTVAITDGRHGAQASDGKSLYFCPVISTKRVDTLGAGDAFASGFTSASLYGKSLKDSLICGTLNANAVVSQYGAQAGLLDYKSMQKQLKQTALRVSMTHLLK
ncbi:MAG: carbohydrate kinase family protein [Candidatus Peregrinibacteria bacterium]